MKAAKGARGKADRLFARLVKDRDGRCVVGEIVADECAGGPNCCHLISRRYSRTRVELDNAICACVKHHRLIDEWPDVKMTVIHHTIGMVRYEELAAQARDLSVKVDWDAELARLRDLANEREAAS